MKVNRRNYYRVLHVQPEAPAEIVTASYRTLMSKLRQHPDLGGDPEQALIINEAYAQLKDPEKRRAYDSSLLQLRGRTRPPERAASAACAFCGADLPASIGPETRCRTCDSPLAAPLTAGRERHELFGRRRAPRTAKTDTLTVLPAWRHGPQAAQLHDLSPGGASILVDAPLQVGQVIRITSSTLDALAVVQACRRVPRLYAVHARLLTAIYLRSRGVFVSTQA